MSLSPPPERGLPPNAGRILIVDSAPQARRFLRSALRAQGFAVVEAFDGEEAILKTNSAKPNLVLLDLDLPDLPGPAVIKRIREWSDVPIIVVTACDEEADKVQALDCGADDYVAEPFGIGELTARIRKALRHRMQMMGSRPMFRVGDVAVDLVRQLVTRGGEEIKLSRREYALLCLLVRHAGRVVMHQEILNEVWGNRSTHLDREYLRIYIARLRQKLEMDPAAPRYILTEPAIGYRIREDAPLVPIARYPEPDMTVTAAE
jgi:two-component system KDP operon response regulator KdpE